MIILLPPHFKELGMRNYQFEKGMCQTIHNEVAMAMSIYITFFQF
jgi:hypothetical protein